MGEERRGFLKRVAAFFTTHKRHIPTAALFFGFLWDLITLGRPDRVFENVVLLSHFAIAAGSILLLNLRARRGSEQSVLLLSATQFSFGSLASGLLVLYGRSGTLEGSLPFFVVLGGFFILNEFLRSRYAIMRAQIGVLFFLLFSYLALVTPVLTANAGSASFFLSGALALGVLALYLALLSVVARSVVLHNLRAIAGLVGGLYIFFNGLYFLNILPPVPLALRSIGIYHAVSKQGSTYLGVYEAPPWWQWYRDTSTTFTLPASRRAYCFSAVFAPVGLSAPIYHRFEKYNETREVWESLSRVRFGIEGGRSEGYRGYTIKSGLQAGLYRCDVETERGALIGRMTFRAIEADTPPLLAQREL